MGAALLRDAVAWTLQAANKIGRRAMVIHAIPKEARRFYERHGFVASPKDPMPLMATVGDLRAAFAVEG